MARAPWLHGRDVVVAWRGTHAKQEWLEDLRLRKKSLCQSKEGAIKVHKGFQAIYNSKDPSTMHDKNASASEQAMEEIERLVSKYPNRGEVSWTVTEHSLGGALALLNAHEAATKLKGLDSIVVISFGAPRVGNAAFERDLKKLGVKILRLVHNPDVVPEAILPVLNEKMTKFLDLEDKDMENICVHAGKELRLKSNVSFEAILNVKELY